MTAEIAILNRSAVALAADSAGTIGQGGSAKIYNAFNKIFELSAHHPVGIMIYGGLDFMGLPFEAIIKQYRKRLGSQSFDHVTGYMDDFIRFLQDEVPWGQEEERQVVRVLWSFYSTLIDQVDNEIRDIIAKGHAYGKGKNNQIIQAVLKKRISLLKDEPFLENFHSKISTAQKSKWKDAVEQVFTHQFSRYNLSKENQKLLLDIGYTALLKGPLSDGRTGIVVAGFGAKEWCPSLAAIEADGIILGKLKFTKKEAVDIGRNGPHATMIGFAQDDMVSTFLNGVDPRYETYVNDGLGKLFSDLVGSFQANPQAVPSQVQGLRTFFDGLRRELNDKLLEYRNKAFRTPIIEMIRFMPAQELATLAASMIEITSLKRRVTRDRETVGGDVDVAVISKAEGFVWIKRKHYFPADLNPRYFRRLQEGPKGDEA